MVDVDFGLKQYIEIFKENGFISINDKPDSDTLCVICGKRYKDSHKGHDYLPAKFCVYSADQDER